MTLSTPARRFLTSLVRGPIKVASTDYPVPREILSYKLATTEDAMHGTVLRIKAKGQA